MKRQDQKSLDQIMKEAYQAHEKMKAESPDEFARWKERQRVQDQEDAERMLLIPYRQRQIPKSVAESIISGVDNQNRKLIVPIFEKQLFKAFKEDRRLVLLLGVVGTGKTLSGCKWLVEQPRGLYLKSREFCAYSEKMSIDRPFIKLYYEAPALFLEEIGTEDEKDVPKIRELLQCRFDNGLKTLGAINATPAESEKLLGTRISRRLFAMGKQIPCTEILCEGEKRRRRLRE